MIQKVTAIVNHHC